MPAAPYDFTINQGKTWILVLHWKKKGSGLYIPTNGWGVLFKAKELPDDSAYVIELDNASNGGATLSESGLITLRMSPTETGALDFVTAWHELVLWHLATFDRKTLLEGMVTLNKGIIVP